MLPGDLPPLPTARRQWLRGGAALALAALAGAGCSTPSPPLRIGADPWLGYQLMLLAQGRGLVHPGQVRLVEMPTASASLRALAAGTLEGAGLTLDEVISARARGLMLQVVAVFDVSNGADVLLASPDITSLAALRGRRVGVEQSATGALLLDAALGAAGLTPADVRLVPLAFDAHATALRSSQVDAVVTFDPARSQLLAVGAQQLFSSAQAPGLIVDVLAVRPEAVHSHDAHLRALVAGVMQARTLWLQDSAGSAALLAPRLHLPPAAVVQAFGRVQLQDLADNHRWLAGPAPALLAMADRLAAVMQRAALLPPAPPMPATPGAGSAQASGLLADARFLPLR